MAETVIKASPKKAVAKPVVKAAAAKPAALAKPAKPAASAKPAAAKPAATKPAVKKPAAVKPAAVKKPAVVKAAKPAAQTVVKVIVLSDEQRYRMVAEAAYYRAESNQFKSDPLRDWIDAEIDIDRLLSGNN